MKIAGWATLSPAGSWMRREWDCLTPGALTIPGPVDRTGARSGSSTQEIATVPNWDYVGSMRVIALSTLREFWETHPSEKAAKEPALAWYRHTLSADWATPMDVKADFRSASILRDGRVVFNLGGNSYRLVVWINYPYRIVYVRFIGTHAQYDRIDAQTI